MTEQHFCSIAQLGEQIRPGHQCPVELTEQLLDRIETLDRRLNAFKRVTRDRAMAEAKAAKLCLEAGQDVGPLHGIPYVAKDLYDVKGEPTAAGCRFLEGNVANRDCTVVRRLSQAGMILLGKTHTVQLAFGAVGINHDQGTPHNPWHRVPHAPGGSSSGSAVAVATGLSPMGLGSDTGGSVRIPASLCGTVGLKTTVGRISRAGVYPLSWTLDSVGPLTRSVEDAAEVYHVLQGEDPEDESTIGIPPHDVRPTLKLGVRGLRVAFGQTLFFDDVDDEVEKAVRQCGEVFRDLGALVTCIDVPEAAAVMEDENRGFMIPTEACVVNQRLLDEHFDDLDPVIAQRMILGRNFSAPDYHILARRWADMKRGVVETLRDVDALIVPTTMIPPLPLDVIDSSLETYLDYNFKYLRNTSIGNILNLCGVSLPCGWTTQGLPIGLMIYAKPYHEEMALRVAYAYEQATSWHTRRPDLSWV